MSQILVQEQKQVTAADILRTHGKKFKQIQNHYSDGKNGRCVIGVLYSYFGWDGKLSVGSLRDPNRKTEELLSDFIIWRDVINMNDHGRTFDQIADWLDSIESK